MEIGNFVKGNINKVLDLDGDISKKRLDICYYCPLYTTRFGGMCNDKLWLNPNTGDVSTIKKEGYKKGCGCKLSYKVKNVNNKCPLGKW